MSLGGFSKILRKTFAWRTKVRDAKKINDSLLELHKPKGTPTIQILFFHGLQPEDSSGMPLSTWKCGDGSYWPQSWLVDEFPNAHVLSVSYYGSTRKDSTNVPDLFIVTENLISDFMKAGIGQIPGCTVVLVGHSFGGLVIKQLCLLADMHRQGSRSSFDKAQLQSFFDNLRGIFYFATPHYGSTLLQRIKKTRANPELQLFRILNEDAKRLSSGFDHLNRKPGGHWHISGLGESAPTDLGYMMVPAASATEENFYVVSGVDHYSICQPESKTAAAFSKLKSFIGDIAREVAEERKLKARIDHKFLMANSKALRGKLHDLPKTTERFNKEKRRMPDAKPRRGNLQDLPKTVVGIEWQLTQVRRKLEIVQSVGLVGVGGVGKTTLVKAIFNELSLKFDYTCFVPDAQSMKKSECLQPTVELLWKHMHYKGKKVEEDERFALRGKQLLLVVDDIREHDEIDDLLDLCCSAQSRFIATSRYRHRVRKLKYIHKVSVLGVNDSKDLFMSHAFPNSAEMPHQLKNFVEDIVQKCCGLPLMLEVLGNFLRMKEDPGCWKRALKALGDGTPVTDANGGVQAALRFSYDNLHEIEKKMFLDATTFFKSGEFSLREAKAAWSKDYGSYSVSNLWRTLVDRSLVIDVEKDEIIKVHELCQRMGQGITAEYSKHGPCRVWEQPTALTLLRSPDQLDIKEFHSFQIETGNESSFGAAEESVHIATPALRKLKQLRFLNINRPVVIPGSQEDHSLLQELVVLKCVGLQIFNLALHSRLVVLKLSLPDAEILPASIGQLSSLKIFVLSDARKLETLPLQIGRLSRLEYLELRSCVRLRTLPQTFGQLFKLKHLKFLECLSLRALPDCFAYLSSLEQLLFFKCEKLSSLPECFGDLRSLVKLEFSYCRGLKTLPVSFGYLPTLSQLNFRHCSLESLPYSFARLSTLKELELSECENMRSLIPYGKMELEYLMINGECVELEKDRLSGGEYVELKMDRLSDSMAGLTPPKDLVTMAPQSTAIDLLPDPLHSTCKSSVEEPGSHLLNATEELSELVEDFIAEIKKMDQGGFLVSSEWLHNLEQHEKEVLMSVLWGAGFSEVYHTSTNILYKRLEQNNADISNPDLSNDASYAGCISDLTRLRTKPAQEEIEEEIQSSIVDTDRKANKDSNLSSPKREEKLTVPTEQLSTSMRSFIAALKERGPRSYFVSTDWLSQLERNELEMLKSICTENGFVQPYRTSSTAYYERIKGDVSTCNDGSTRSRDSDDAGRPVDTATSGEDKKPSDSHPKDQRSFKIDNEDDMPGALPTTGATQPRPKADGTGCVEQLLEVTCTPCPGTSARASTSSQNLTPKPRDCEILSCGDSYVTLPSQREDYKIATKVERTFIVRHYQYRKANELIKDNVSLQVSAETTVSCCLRSDNNEKEVRVKFSKLKGQIKHVEGPDILDLVLESVRTNVGAGIYVDDIKSRHIDLDLKDPKFRRVDDDVCLAPCGEGPTSAPPGSLNFELSCEGRKRTPKRWLSLPFQDTKRPVTIEGDIPLSFSDAMSLKLFVEYQLVLCYTKPCGDTVKPFVRTKEARPEIDLGCTLNYRARNCP